MQPLLVNVCCAQTCALKRKEQNENLKSAICNSISDGTGLGLGHAISYSGMSVFPDEIRFHFPLTIKEETVSTNLKLICSKKATIMYDEFVCN